MTDELCRIRKHLHAESTFPLKGSIHHGNQTVEGDISYLTTVDGVIYGWIKQSGDGIKRKHDVWEWACVSFDDRENVWRHGRNSHQSRPTHHCSQTTLPVRR